MSKYEVIKYTCVDTEECSIPSEFLIGKYPDKKSALMAKEEAVESQEQHLESLNQEYDICKDTDDLWSIHISEPGVDTHIEILIEEI